MITNLLISTFVLELVLYVNNVQIESDVLQSFIDNRYGYAVHMQATFVSVSNGNCCDHYSMSLAVEFHHQFIQ